MVNSLSKSVVNIYQKMKVIQTLLIVALAILWQMKENNAERDRRKSVSPEVEDIETQTRDGKCKTYLLILP